MAKDEDIIYRTKTRHYTPNYPYRIIVARHGKEILIQNYSVEIKEITHGVGVTRKDLERIVKKLK